MGNILKKTIIRWFIILTLVFVVSFSPISGNCCKGYAYALNYSTTPIVFSNIKDGTSGSGYPSICYSTSINGYNVNGHIYVRFRDLAQPLGATYTIAPGPTYILTINGQSNYFYPNSINSYSLIFYSIINRSTGQTVPYSFDFHGTLPYPVITVNGYPCVWVKYAALALGSLLVHRDNTTGKFVIYHWRVNNLKSLPFMPNII